MSNTSGYDINWDEVITDRVSSETFSLDTSYFADFISKADSLAEKMENLKSDLDTFNATLLQTWAGAGRNTFQTKYRLLSQQFGDLKEDLRDISDNLKSIEQEYIQRDTDLAKAMDGMDSRY